MTTKVTRAPRVKFVPKAVTKACWRARSIAMPPKARTNASGVASMRRVSVGAQQSADQRQQTVDHRGGVLALFLPGSGEQGVGRASDTGRDRAEGGIEQGTPPRSSSRRH